MDSGVLCGNCGCAYSAVMSSAARLLGIYVAAKAEDVPGSFARVQAHAGRGLEEDRYATGLGTFSDRPGKRDVTLIEVEVLEAFARESG